MDICRNLANQDFYKQYNTAGILPFQQAKNNITGENEYVEYDMATAADCNFKLLL